MNDIRPKRRDDLLTQTLVDEFLIIDMDGQVVHVLNPTAKLVWSLCDGDHTPSDIVAIVQAQYKETAADTISADVATTLAELREKKVLVDPP